ncbi:hypothetical protein [Candidatus Magnetaquiglobus chichijimensis]|uniref:hypothetical protein n=1 Tax=Candidatus Magnetaquiglobus chichijimensis TaxID=3141448 RepID=UPI003B97B92A
MLSPSRYWLFLLLVLSGAIVEARESEGVLPVREKQVMTTLGTGIHLGECMVYCDEEIWIKENIILYQARSPWPDEEMFPDIRQEIPLDDATAQTIWNQVDPAVFPGLPARTGQPDADDRGMEWLVYGDHNGQVRIEFPAGEPPASVAQLHALLRALRLRLSRKLRPDLR